MVFESGYGGGGVVDICDRDFGSLGTSSFRPRYVEGCIFDAGYGMFVWITVDFVACRVGVKSARLGTQSSPDLVNEG